MLCFHPNWPPVRSTTCHSLHSVETHFHQKSFDSTLNEHWAETWWPLLAPGQINRFSSQLLPAVVYRKKPKYIVAFFKDRPLLIFLICPWKNPGIHDSSSHCYSWHQRSSKSWRMRWLSKCWPGWPTLPGWHTHLSPTYFDDLRLSANTFSMVALSFLFAPHP